MCTLIVRFEVEIFVSEVEGTKNGRESVMFLLFKNALSLVEVWITLTRV